MAFGKGVTPFLRGKGSMEWADRSHNLPLNKKPIYGEMKK